MTTKYEVVITRYEDGMFKSRHRAEFDSILEMQDGIDEKLLDVIRAKVDEEYREKQRRLKDDDIPF